MYVHRRLKCAATVKPHVRARVKVKATGATCPALARRSLTGLSRDLMRPGRGAKNDSFFF